MSTTSENRPEGGEDQPTSDGSAHVSVGDTLPALARFAAETSIRTAGWGVETSVRLSGRLARAALEPQYAVELMQEASAEIRGYVRQFLGIPEIEQQLLQLMPANELRPNINAVRRMVGDDGDIDPELLLRAEGAELLRRSADVNYDDRAHPAYTRLLEELAPDEARILRLLAAEGTQPAVDVRSSNLIGVGSQLVARSLNMVGPQAGCRHPERTPSYLNNLHRLGLIFFSEEALEDPIAYQVLEAQPDVLDAIKSATRAKSIHRSIQLSPFGRDFCEVCLPLDASEVHALTEGT